MASTKEDNIPLVAVKPHKSNYFRATSCFEEPEVGGITNFKHMNYKKIHIYLKCQTSLACQMHQN